jgi:hypothetical protein
VCVCLGLSSQSDNTKLRPFCITTCVNLKYKKHVCVPGCVWEVGPVYTLKSNQQRWAPWACPCEVSQSNIGFVCVCLGLSSQSVNTKVRPFCIVTWC